MQDRGQRARWKAASSAGRRVPLLVPSLVSSGRKLRGPENPALCCRPTFVCPCVCLRLSVFVLCVLALSLVSFRVCCVCVCRHCIWSRSLLVIVGRPKTLLSQRSPKASMHSHPHLGRLSAGVAGALHHRRTGANFGRGTETGPGGRREANCSASSRMRGFLCCGLTGILSEPKVGSVFECTARL